MVLAVVSCLVGVANSAIEKEVTKHLLTCGYHMLNHVACETLALIRLACVDITLSQVVIMASSVVVLLISCCLVSLSYTQIMATILRIHSTSGCSKAVPPTSLWSPCPAGWPWLPTHIPVPRPQRSRTNWW